MFIQTPWICENKNLFFEFYLISENFIETSYLLDIDTIIVLFLQVVRFEYRTAWKIKFLLAKENSK